jgi:F0F1-type ATP synthase assembly protein I
MNISDDFISGFLIGVAVGLILEFAIEVQREWRKK